MSEVLGRGEGHRQQTVWPDDVAEARVRDVPDTVQHAGVRRVLPCGHLDLGDSWHGGRPYQCVHEWEAR